MREREIRKDRFSRAESGDHIRIHCAAKETRPMALTRHQSLSNKK